MNYTNTSAIFTEPGAPPSAAAPGFSGGILVRSSIALIVLTTIAVGLRFVGRSMLRPREYWWDDWTALIAWATFIVYASLAVAASAYSDGHHIETLTIGRLNYGSKLDYVRSGFYPTSLTAAKLSALFFYIRVFQTPQWWFRWAVGISFFSCIAWCITVTFLTYLQCVPSRSLWDMTILTFRCLPLQPVFYSSAIWSIVNDGLILLIPMPLICRLQTTVRRKISLSFTFLIGYFTLAISITRAIVVTNDAEDQTWVSPIPLAIQGLEIGMCLISVCLPAHLPLVRRLVERFGSHEEKRLFGPPA